MNESSQPSQSAPTDSSLAHYVLLGRSGLRVSRLCLGAMTFGDATKMGPAIARADWGSKAAESRRIFDCFLAAGGNFIDTADVYTGGDSEELLGKFIAASNSRDRVVLASKFSINTDPGNPNAAGNGRKCIYQALEKSLKRLQTDYLDLYWLHFWDMLTPIEELMETMEALIKAGKVRYFGLSDVPAWYFARAQTLAELRGMPRVIALQLQYSLTERSIEREHVPAALELGAGITPWSPLAAGFLTGKYSRESIADEKTEGRLSKQSWYQFGERDWRILDTLQEVAKATGVPPAQIALNWVCNRPGVASTIIGASSQAQLESNMAALDVQLPAEWSAKLEEVSRPHPTFPYTMFAPPAQDMLTRAKVAKEPPNYRP
ncbi:MAG: aldo/keto reductase [Cellvibrionales bacterium]|nr:aldo/keto reductase [Cellvibrionales bacterium]